jgi:hypothetical protein
VPPHPPLPFVLSTRRPQLDPLSPASFFQVAPLESDGRFILRWPSNAGARYRIETTGNLSGTWGALAAELIAASDLTEFDVGPVAGPSFFRVVLK